MAKAITIILMAIPMFYFYPIALHKIATTPCYVRAFSERTKSHETPAQANARCALEYENSYKH
jgi:hypothetical protein